MSMIDDQFKRMSDDSDNEAETNEFGEDATDGFEEEEEVTISITSDDDEDHLDDDDTIVIAATPVMEYQRTVAPAPVKPAVKAPAAEKPTRAVGKTAAN